MMSISPDGTMVAFRRYRAQQDLVLVYLDDSHVILVASDDRFMRGYRGHHRRSSAFSLDVGSGAVEQLLTPGNRIIAGQVGVGRLVGASADGQRVFMPAFTESRFRDADYSLMEINLDSVRSPRILRRGSEHTIDYFVDDSGAVLAEEFYNERTNVHRIVSYMSGEAVSIHEQEAEYLTIAAVALTADRKALIVEADSGATDRSGYYAMSLADGTTEPIFTRPDADVEMILTDVNRVAYGAMYSGLTPSYKFFDEKVSRRMADTATRTTWSISTSPGTWNGS